MATSWADTINLLTDQTALVSAEVVMHDMNGLHLRLEIPECELDINCYWDGFQFQCSHPDADGLIMATETRLVDPGDPKFLIEVRFKALVDGIINVAFSFVTGNADVENVTLTAD